MKLTYRTLILPAALALSFALVACGGGGSSGTGTAGNSGSTDQTVVQSVITYSNYQSAAAEGYQASVNALSAAGIAKNLTGGVEVSTPSKSLEQVSLEVFERVRSMAMPAVAGVAYSKNCDSGTLTGVDNSTDSNKPTAGDTVLLTANNCQFAGLPLLNGKIDFVITSFAGDIVNSTNYTLGVAVNYTDFSLTSGADLYKVVGDLEITITRAGISSTSIAAKGSSLESVHKSSGIVVSTRTLSGYQFGASTSVTGVSTEFTYGLSGSSTKLGKYAYQVQSLKPFVTSAGKAFPSSGAAIMKGTGSSVTVTAVDSKYVRIDFSANDDGKITTSTMMTWSDFFSLAS